MDCMCHMQLDVEVTFKYPNLSTAVGSAAADVIDPFDCTQGGSSHRGVFGPFGLLVSADEDFQEQLAVFFYIAHKGNSTWTTYFCSDQSRFDERHLQIFLIMSQINDCPSSCGEEHQI